MTNAFKGWGGCLMAAPMLVFALVARAIDAVSRAWARLRGRR